MLRTPLWLAIPLAVFGFAEFAWGVVTFVRERPPAPRAAIVVALIPVLAWVAGLAFAGRLAELGGPSTLLPLGIASAFELFIAAALGRTLRTPTSTDRPSTARYLTAVGAGLLVTAALLVVALAAAQAPWGASSPLNIPTHHGD